MILTRQDLHRRVWAKPMPEVARDLGITAAALSRLCRTLDVPFPYSSYWRQGAPLDSRPRALPRARLGCPTEVELDLPNPPAAPPAEASLESRYDLIHERLRDAVQRAGHTVELADGSPGFQVKGQALTWWVREGYTRTKRPPTSKEARDPWTAARGYLFEERTNGRFILAVQTKAYGRKVEWRDHPRRGRLEDRTEEIVAGLEALADDITRHDAERRAAEARWREAEDRRLADERRARAEADRWERLCRLAEQHEETRRVAAFVQRLRAENRSAADGDPALRAWFAWAQDHVAAYNPLTWDMSQVVGEVDRPPRQRPWPESLDDDETDDG